MDLTVSRVLAVLRLHNSVSPADTHRIKRERWALILKIQGKTFYKVNGCEILSDRLHPILLPKGCSYSWNCAEEGDCYIIEFEALEERALPISFSISDPQPLLKGFDRIERALQSLEAHRELLCKQFFYEMLYFLFKSKNRNYLDPKKKALLNPAIEYIARFYQDPDITNDSLSSRCGISTVYFRKLFESVYGISPMKYLQLLRLEKAKSLLKSDFDTIGQVAQSVGYNSIYHFSKMFRNNMGISPREYSKK